jgi:single-stranded DNA-binding protein
MTVYILISGSIFRQPQQRNSASGRPYVSATIKTAGADNESSDFWSVLAFGDSTRAELVRLADGEKVSVQGKPKFEIFEKDGKPRISRTVFADSVLALRAPPREKKPKSAGPAASQAPQLQPVNIVPEASSDFNDDIPF